VAPTNSRGPLVLFLAVAAVVVAWQAALLMLGDDADEVPPPAHVTPAPPEPEPAPQAPAASAEADAAPTPPADYTLTVGEVATLVASELPKDRAVTLGLTLPVASRDATPLRAKIVDANGRTRDAKATIQGATRQSAHLDVDPGWLSPGTYMIHLTTNEAAVLPLRRFVLQVR
jgi:hypothetical protein